MRQNYIPFNNLSTYASPGNSTYNPLITPGVRGNLINPASRKNHSTISPAEYRSGTPGTPGYQAGSNLYGVGSSPNNNDQFDIKLDDRITDYDQLSVRFSRDWTTSSVANLFGNVFDANTQGPTNHVAYSGALNYTHTFNPTTLLTGTVGYDHAFAQTAGIGAAFPGFDFGQYNLPSKSRDIRVYCSSRACARRLQCPENGNVTSADSRIQV